MTRHDIDRAAARLAAAQHQVFRHDQAHDLGASQQAISRRVLTGRWLRPYPGVLALPGWDRSVEGRLLAAVWSLKGGVVSGRAAAEVLEFEGAPKGVVEATVAPGDFRARPFTVHQSAIPPDQIIRVGLLPVTSRERSLLVMASWWGPKRLERAAEAELAAGRITAERLAQVATGLVGHGNPATPKIEALVDHLQPGFVAPASELERMLFQFIEEAGFPPLARQYPLPAFSIEGCVDGAYDYLRLIVEADGRKYHTKLAQMELDKARDAEAGALDWHVVRLTYFTLRFRRRWARRVIGKHFERAGWRQSPSGLWAPSERGGRVA